MTAVGLKQTFAKDCFRPEGDVRNCRSNATYTDPARVANPPTCSSSKLQAVEPSWRFLRW